MSELNVAGPEATIARVRNMGYAAASRCGEAAVVAVMEGLPTINQQSKAELNETTRRLQVLIAGAAVRESAGEDARRLKGIDGAGARAVEGLLHRLRHGEESE